MKMSRRGTENGCNFDGNYQQSHRLGDLMAPTHDNHPFAKVVVNIHHYIIQPNP